MAFDYNNYDQLEYIQSSGTQFIILDLNSDAGYEYELDFNIPAMPSAYDRLLGRNAAYHQDYVSIRPNGYLYCNLGSKELQIAPYTTNTDYKVIWNSTASGKFCTFNGVTKTQSDFNNTNTPNIQKVSLFGSTSTDQSVVNLCSYKFKHLIIKENNVIVAELMPARRKADLFVGLYDTVNNVFYTNNGGGSFIAGPVVIVETKAIKIKINNVWKNSTPYIKVNGVWKETTPYIKVNGVWKKAIQ